MNRFKPGDIVYNVTSEYSVTNYRTFFVGIVVHAPNDKIIRVAPIYTTEGNSVCQKHFHSSRLTDSMQEEYTQTIHPAIKILLSNSSDKHDYVLASLRLESTDLQMYSVASRFFELVKPHHLALVFDRMHEEQLKTKRFAVHRYYRMDYPRIRNEFLEEVGYFLKLFHPMHLLESFEVVSEINW